MITKDTLVLRSLKENLRTFVFFILKMDYQEVFNQSKEHSIRARYVALRHIEPLLLCLQKQGKASVLGHSVLGQPIYVYHSGTGATKIIMWSQMHGNESTTTKALFDLFNFLDSEKGKELQKNLSFCIIPMLNPDGAGVWTRNNANDIDLNRDSQELSQPESQLLRRCIEDFQPDLCFNLHDQRTIFGVEKTKNPATVSFLAPSYDPEKTLNATRKKAMEVIAYMNTTLQSFIPNQVGRFDDGFNINCIGDTVQHLGIPTVLVEAGHFQGDYLREETRKYVFIALLSALCNFKLNSVLGEKYLEYFNIPNNMIFFFDFIYRNVKLNYENSQIITNFAVHYFEKVEKQSILFEALVKEIGSLEGFHGHFEWDAKGEEYQGIENNFPEVGQKADFVIGTQQFKNGVPL